MNILGDAPRTIILAGAGRSGTTWLSQIIGANFNFQVVFEPFDSRVVPEAMPFGYHPYWPTQSKNEAWSQLIGQLGRGEIQNAWTQRLGKRPFAWRYLIKTIRATALLPWLSHHFNYPTVFMMRHPCAVVLSRMKLEWDPHFDIYLNQPELMRDYLDPFREHLSAVKTDAQKHALMWCFENYVPYQHLNDYGWLFCTYEELVKQTEEEVKRLLEPLQIKSTWRTQKMMQRISPVTRKDSAILSNDKPLRAWQQKLSQKDIEDILALVKMFGFDIYNHDPLPTTMQG
ncbi:MAG TPA: sulfotransferase domain-containing protein [Anaerolineae bacterium]|nr:sulfotransferase domain-containing protein [Anaerolineae bacterium]